MRLQNLTKINNIKTYDFSMLYGTILHDNFNSRLFDIIDICLFIKNVTSKNVLPYYWKSLKLFWLQVLWSDIEKMLEFLIDKIYVVLWNQVFQQSVGTQDALLYWLTFFHIHLKRNLFKILYKNRIKHLLCPSTRQLYIYDVYPSELEMKDTTYF